MERAGDWLKDAYATAGKPNEGPYKFSDPLGGGEPYVPSAAELKAKPPVAKARVAEPTPDLDAQIRKQLPKAPLVGPRTNAPMPVARPTSVEYGIEGKPSEGVIVNPLSGAGASETGKVKGQINPDTGEEMPYQPTQAEIDRAQAAGKPVMQMLEGEAKEDLPFRTAGAGIGNPEYAGRTAAERDIERRAEARQSYEETLATMTDNKKALEDRLQNYRDRYAAGKIKKIDLDEQERVLGRTIKDADEKIDNARKAMVNAAQTSITQSGVVAAAQRVPQTIAEQVAGTATALARIGTAPASLVTYIVNGGKIPEEYDIQNSVTKQDIAMKRAIRTAFNADATQAEDLSQQVVQGIASTAGFMVGGGLLRRAVALSEPMAIAVAGALPQASEMWSIAEQRAQKDPSVNQNWRKWTSFVMGLGIGATEALPISRLFDRLENVSGGGMTRWVGAVLASSGEEGLHAVCVEGCPCVDESEKLVEDTFVSALQLNDQSKNGTAS
jgi:hypothetical protein